MIHIQLESLDRLSSAEGGGLMITSFGLRKCDGVDPSDMISILELKSLQHLTLRSSCRLHASVVHALTPPSTLLPNLAEFDSEYWREGESEDEVEECGKRCLSPATDR